MTNKETIQALVEALQELAAALPKDKSTVKTCYAIHNGHRDMVHAALLAGQQLLAQEGKQAESIDAITLRETGFDGDGTQVMNRDDIHRIVHAALAQEGEKQGPVVYLQVYRCGIKSREKIEAEIPREKQGWWADVCPGETLRLRQAVQLDIDRCTLNEAHSRKPDDYMCETFKSGALVAKYAIEFMNPEQNVFAAAPAPKEAV